MRKLKFIFMAFTVLLTLTGAAAAQRRATPVYLSVEIDNLVSQVSGIRSDGGVYVNGAQSVQAQITDYGWLQF